MELSLTPQHTGDTYTLSAAGEIDVSCADTFRDALNTALESGATEVIVELSQVSYIDSTGIGVLVGAAHHAAEKGLSLICENPQRNVSRVLGLLGVDAELNVRNA